MQRLDRKSTSQLRRIALAGCSGWTALPEAGGETPRAAREITIVP